MIQSSSVSNRRRLKCFLLALCAVSVIAGILVLSSTGNGEEPQEPVRFKVSGSIAEKLPDDVRVTIWAPGKHRGYIWPISEMPVAMRWEDFVRFNGKTSVPTGAYVDFRNDRKRRILGVLLSHDLFDKPRTINIVLERPDTFVKPASIFGGFGFRYHALISRRMQYSDVPRWDGKKREFLTPSLPVLQIYKAANGELLQETEMQQMCYGYGWALHIDFPAELADETELQIVVVHDTGDLFGRLRTECSFTYKKEAHSQVGQAVPDAIGSTMLFDRDSCDDLRVARPAASRIVRHSLTYGSLRRRRCGT